MTGRRRVPPGVVVLLVLLVLLVVVGVVSMLERHVDYAAASISPAPLGAELPSEGKPTRFVSSLTAG